jgi:hypothetical protein
MVGSYSNNAFGSGFPQPTGMGNGYRRNPASTRQNQIGNGPNPTGAQTVGQLQPLPGAYGQQGQMQQASGMQPLDTQTAMFKLFNVMKKQRSNVYQQQRDSNVSNVTQAPLPQQPNGGASGGWQPLQGGGASGGWQPLQGGGASGGWQPLQGGGASGGWQPLQGGGASGGGSFGGGSSGDGLPQDGWQPLQGDGLPQDGWQPGKAYTDLTPNEKEKLLLEKRATLGGLNATTAEMRGLSAKMRILAAPDMARREEVARNYAQQIAASEGSLAYQQGQTGNVPGLAGMRNAQARQEFRDGTPGGRQMDRFDKLLAQRGQQPQQGQYQSNVEQPTKNSQDALKRYYDDGDPATDRNGNSTPTLRSFTNDVGQKMLIKKSDDGRYALTGSGRRTPEDVAKIAADRQERIANASPALQKRAFDTARRRGQPRGNAVSNAMLRKQGLSPEQISNVYAGTQDKETTQLMRQPQSAVGPAVNGTPTVASRVQAGLDAKTNNENSPALKQFGVPHDAGRNEYDTRFSALIDSKTEIDADMLSEIQQQFSLASVADPEFLRENGSAFDNEWDRFKNKHFQKFAIADTPEKQATWMSEYKAGKEKFGTVVKRAKASGERNRNPFGM